MIRCVIFDMDGVLLNSEPFHKLAAEDMLDKYGVVRDGEILDFTGMPVETYWGIFQKMYNIPRTVEELAAEYYERVAELVESNKLPRSEGLTEVFEWIREKGIKTGLASSSSRLLVNRTLKHLGMESLIDFSAAGSEVDKRKPDPDLYLKVMELAGVTAEEAVAVEDSESGIRSAQSAGLYCIGYRNLTSGERDISSADYQISELKEIMTAACFR